MSWDHSLCWDNIHRDEERLGDHRGRLGMNPQQEMALNMKLPPLHTETFGSTENSQPYSRMVQTLPHTQYPEYFYSNFPGFAVSPKTLFTVMVQVQDRECGCFSTKHWLN